MPHHRIRRLLLRWAITALMTVCGVATAHEIPVRVSVQMWVAADDGLVTVLVRAPLEAMRDLDLPLRGPGYLDLERSAPVLRDAAGLWIVDYLDLHAGGSALPDPEIAAIRVSLPSDRSFADFESALAHLQGPALPNDTELYWQQAQLDLLLRYRAPADTGVADLAVDSRLAHLGQRTTTVLHVRQEDGDRRSFTFEGRPGRVALDPSPLTILGQFIASGFTHILGGIDHLLFVLCLVIPVRRLRPLVAIVTAFTLAHSITLVAAALGAVPGALWFPPLVEALIALSILWMAIENVLGVGITARWQTAFCFGLVHGFGFAFVLQDSLQFAGGHLLLALISFNLGVELGQIAVLLMLVPLLALLMRGAREQLVSLLLAALVAHTAWHWLLERCAAFLAYPLTWPSADPETLLLAVRLALVALIAVAALWGLDRLYRRWLDPDAGPGPR